MPLDPIPTFAAVIPMRRMLLLDTIRIFQTVYPVTRRRIEFLSRKSHSPIENLKRDAKP
jgi:hypothetical protein